VRTIRANGINVPIYVPEDASLGQFLSVAGTKVSGVYYWASFSPAHPKTALQSSFATAWTSANGSAPTDFDSAGYAQAQILVAAIKHVLSKNESMTRVNVNKALNTMGAIPTVYGTVTYSTKNHGEPFATVPVLEYKNGVSYQVAG
jgi:ABC-type branched-subunit amino acid transport system substrate-binding protein